MNLSTINNVNKSWFTEYMYQYIFINQLHLRFDIIRFNTQCTYHLEFIVNANITGIKTECYHLQKIVSITRFKFIFIDNEIQSMFSLTP